jgi:hypothetical protein
MYVKRMIVLVVVIFSLALTVPVLADAPGEGTVYEGVSVPGIALGDSRAKVEASVGPHSQCRSNNDPPTMDSCRFDVEGGGWVDVRFQGANGGPAAGSPDDVVARIQWSEDVDGWVTSAGISIQMIKFDRQLAMDTYPDAVLFYNDYGSVVRLTDYDQGITITWDAVYIFFSASMSIFEPYEYVPPPPPDYIRVPDIEMQATRRTVTATVLVVDDEDQPVEGADISGFWVYPVNKNNNTTLFFSSTIGADGKITFEIGDKARPGTYRINIESVSKEGYVFDQSNSVLVETLLKSK